MKAKKQKTESKKSKSVTKKQLTEIIDACLKIMVAQSDYAVKLEECSKEKGRLLRSVFLELDAAGKRRIQRNTDIDKLVYAVAEFEVRANAAGQIVIDCIKEHAIKVARHNS